MSEAAAKAFDLFTADIGNDEGTGEWFEVTQDQIDQFADVTHDHQFIHVDPERAAATPFGSTIAHGFLTLSMLTHLAAGASSAPPDPAKYEGVLMGINYGFNKVRFVSPVKVGSAHPGPGRDGQRRAQGHHDRGHPQLHHRDRGRGEAGPRRRLAHPHRLRLTGRRLSTGPVVAGLAVEREQHHQGHGGQHHAQGQEGQPGASSAAPLPGELLLGELRRLRVAVVQAHCRHSSASRA